MLTSKRCVFFHQSSFISQMAKDLSGFFRLFIDRLPAVPVNRRIFPPAAEPFFRGFFPCQLLIPPSPPPLQRPFQDLFLQVNADPFNFSSKDFKAVFFQSFQGSFFCLFMERRARIFFFAAANDLDILRTRTPIYFTELPVRIF